MGAATLWHSAHCLCGDGQVKANEAVQTARRVEDRNGLAYILRVKDEREARFRLNISRLFHPTNIPSLPLAILEIPSESYHT